jgi:hypothetical protein
LNWSPETDLKLVLIEDEITSHALISVDDNSRVRILSEDDNWPQGKPKRMLKKDGC